MSLPCWRQRRRRSVLDVVGHRPRSAADRRESRVFAKSAPAIRPAAPAPRTFFNIPSTAEQARRLRAAPARPTRHRPRRPTREAEAGTTERSPRGRCASWHIRPGPAARPRPGPGRPADPQTDRWRGLRGIGGVRAGASAEEAMPGSSAVPAATYRKLRLDTPRCASACTATSPPLAQVLRHRAGGRNQSARPLPGEGTTWSRAWPSSPGLDTLGLEPAIATAGWCRSRSRLAHLEPAGCRRGWCTGSRIGVRAARISSSPPEGNARGSPPSCAVCRNSTNPLRPRAAREDRGRPRRVRGPRVRAP